MDRVVSGSIKKRVEKRAAAKPKVMVGGSEKDDEEDHDDVQEIEDSDQEMYESPPPRARRPKRRASFQERTPGTPTNKSKRARRAEKQEPYNESSDFGSESEDVVVVDSEEDEWTPEGKIKRESTGTKRNSRHAGQQRK